MAKKQLTLAEELKKKEKQWNSWTPNSSNAKRIVELYFSHSVSEDERDILEKIMLSDKWDRKNLLKDSLYKFVKNLKKEREKEIKRNSSPLYQQTEQSQIPFSIGSRLGRFPLSFKKIFFDSFYVSTAFEVLFSDSQKDSFYASHMEYIMESPFERCNEDLRNVFTDREAKFFILLLDNLEDLIEKTPSLSSTCFRDYLGFLNGLMERCQRVYSELSNTLSNLEKLKTATLSESNLEKLKTATLSESNLEKLKTAVQLELDILKNFESFIKTKGKQYFSEHSELQKHFLEKKDEILEKSRHYHINESFFYDLELWLANNETELTAGRFCPFITKRNEYDIDVQNSFTRVILDSYLLGLEDKEKAKLCIKTTENLQDSEIIIFRIKKMIEQAIDNSKKRVELPVLSKTDLNIPAKIFNIFQKNFADNPDLLYICFEDLIDTIKYLGIPDLKSAIGFAPSHTLFLELFNNLEKIDNVEVISLVTGKYAEFLRLDKFLKITGKSSKETLKGFTESNIINLSLLYEKTSLADFRLSFDDLKSQDTFMSFYNRVLEKGSAKDLADLSRELSLICEEAVEPLARKFLLSTEKNMDDFTKKITAIADKNLTELNDRDFSYGFSPDVQIAYAFMIFSSYMDNEIQVRFARKLIELHKIEYGDDPKKEEKNKKRAFLHKDLLFGIMMFSENLSSEAGKLFIDTFDECIGLSEKPKGDKRFAYYQSGLALDLLGEFNDNIIIINHCKKSEKIPFLADDKNKRFSADTVIKDLETQKRKKYFYPWLDKVDMRNLDKFTRNCLDKNLSKEDVRAFLGKTLNSIAENPQELKFFNSFILELISLNKNRIEEFTNKKHIEEAENWNENLKSWPEKAREHMSSCFTFEDILRFTCKRLSPLSSEEAVGFIRDSVISKNKNIYNGVAELEEWNKFLVDYPNDQFAKESRRDTAYLLFLYLLQEDFPFEKKKLFAESLSKFKSYVIKRYLDEQKIDEKNLVSFLIGVSLTGKKSPVKFSSEHAEYVLKKIVNSMKSEENLTLKTIETFSKFLKKAGKNLLKIEEKEKTGSFYEVERQLYNMIGNSIASEDLNSNENNFNPDFDDIEIF